MAGGSPLCLAGRWSVDWFWQRDWQNVGWLLIGGWIVVLTAILRLKLFLAVDRLHRCRLPSLLSWSLVGWLVLAKRLKECWLTVDWWVARCFLLQNWDYKTDVFLAVDWLHGWRLPCLLSWSVVGWLVLAKRLTECWLTVGWWVAWCFFTAKLRLKIWWFFWVDWLHGWRLPSLLSCSVVGWLVLVKRLTECWLAVDWWVDRCFFTAILRLKLFFSSWLAAPLFA